MPSKHIKTIIKLVIYTVSILAVFFLMPKLIRFFIPFVIGWILSLIANPIVKFFEKRFNVVRKHGSWVVIVGVLALVVIGCYFFISAIMKEAIAFVGSMPSNYETLTTGINDIIQNITNMFPMLPAGLTETMAEFLMNIDRYIAELVGKVGTPVLGVAGDFARNIPNLLVMMIFMFLSAYFFVVDKEILGNGIKKIIPQAFFEKWQWVKYMFSRAVGGYFVAQFKIMGVIAIILWIGLMLLDINYAILWAVVIAILDFLPFFGTGFVIWPWSVYELLTGNFKMVAGLLAIYFVCLLVHQLLQPKFVGNTVGMDSFTTLFCMFVGYRISSVIGMIIAVPIGIIIINLYKEGFFNHIISDVKALIDDLVVYLKKEA